MADEGVAQLEDGGGIQGVVVGEEDVAAVGDVLGVVEVPHVAEGVEGGEQEVEGEAAEDALLLAQGPVDADVELVRVVGIEAGLEEVEAEVVGGRVAVGAEIALGHLGEEFEGDGIGIGNLVAGEGLAGAVGVVGLGGVVDGEAVAGEVAVALGGGGNDEVVGAVVALFLGVLVVAEEVELAVLDGTADGAAFLVAVEVEAPVLGWPLDDLALLVEVLVGAQDVGAEDAEGIAVELVGAGLGGEAR